MEQSVNLKKDSGDFRWETRIPEDPSNANNMKCILSSNVTNEGINRHKIQIVSIKRKGVKPFLKEQVCKGAGVA